MIAIASLLLTLTLSLIVTRVDSMALMLTGLSKEIARMEVRDYVAVLHLQNEYAVSELTVEPQDWLARKTLMDLRLPAEGVLVLGVQRLNGTYIGAPTADTEVRTDDTLILYGPLHRVQELDQRRKGRQGEDAHIEAIEEHEEILEEQDGAPDESKPADAKTTPESEQ